MKTITIIGGGIGGLTVAHELSKYNEYNISIFERNNDIGGLARSKRDENGCATEYCWRVFFGFYDNLFKTFGEIKDNNQSILNYLTPYKHLNINDTPESKKDYIYSVLFILYGLTSCDKRLDKLDELSWWDALHILPNTSVLRSIGPWLGMDRYKGSYKSVIKVGTEMQIIKSKTDTKYIDYITTRPTSETLFDPWKKHLEKNKVQINLNTVLQSIKIKDNEITEIEVYDNNTKTIKKIKSDYYVFNLPVEILDQFIDKTPELNYGDFKNIKELKNNCLHHQLSFQVFFNESISLKEYNAFLLVDSPWDLIILSYDKVYNGVNICDNIPNAKGAWSVAVCTSYIPGIKIKKPFDKCTYEEIITEIWAQLTNSKKLNKIVKENNNFELNDKLIIKWSKMWDTWFLNKEGNIQTTEPKFTNNKGSWKIRPSYKTHIKNLYLSTAYIKETIDIFSMEAANIAGKRVANDINNNVLKPTIRERPTIFKIFRQIDQIFYNIGLPNINIPLIVLIIIVIIYILIKKI